MHVYKKIWTFGLSLGLLSNVCWAGPMAMDEGERVQVVWEVGEPAIENVEEVGAALLLHKDPSTTFPGTVAVDIFVPNELPLNRAYQVRLLGELLSAEGKPLNLDLAPGPPSAPSVNFVDISPACGGDRRTMVVDVCVPNDEQRSQFSTNFQVAKIFLNNL